MPMDSETSQFLAEECMPEGGHKVPEDWSYVILMDPLRIPTEANLGSKSSISGVEIPKKSGGKHTPARLVYGISFFRNVPDPTVPRGAIQKAVLVLLYRSFFLLLKPVLREAHSKLIQLQQRPESFDKSITVASILEQLFYGLEDSLSKNVPAFTIWEQKFILDIPIVLDRDPVLDVDEEKMSSEMISPPKTAIAKAWNLDPIPGVSVLNFIKLFKSETMLIWKAVLFRLRILFVGPSGDSVGSCCLVCPYLILPLEVPFLNIYPYVPLAYMSPLETSCYIAGATNPITKMRKDLFDVCGDVNSKEILVSNSSLKLSSKEKSFIRKILNEIDKGTVENLEEWVREQFREYTQAYLSSISFLDSTDAISSSSMYLNYLQQCEDLEAGDIALRNLGQIQAAQVSLLIVSVLTDKLDPEIASSMNPLQILTELDANLVSTGVRELVFKIGGIKLLLPIVRHEDPNLKKLAFSILCKLAIIPEASVEMLSGDNFVHMIPLIRDPDESVSAAAAYFLRIIGSTKEGTISLLGHKPILEDLGSLILSPIASDAAKFNAVCILQQLSESCPDFCPPESISRATDGKHLSPLADYYPVFLELLDLWSLELPPWKPSPDVSAVLVAMSGPINKNVIKLFNNFAQLVDANPHLVIELIMQNGMEMIISLNLLKTSKSQLTRSFWKIMMHICECNVGLRRVLMYSFETLMMNAYLVSLDFCSSVLSELVLADSVISLPYIYSIFFVEFASQHFVLAPKLLKVLKPETLCGILKKNKQKSKELGIASLPLLRSLKYFAASCPLARESLTTACDSIKSLMVKDIAVVEDLDEVDFQNVLVTVLISLGIIGEECLESFSSRQKHLRSMKEQVAKMKDAASKAFGEVLLVCEDPIKDVEELEWNRYWVELEKGFLKVCSETNRTDVRFKLSLEYVVIKNNPSLLVIDCTSIDSIIKFKCSSEEDFKAWTYQFSIAREFALNIHNQTSGQDSTLRAGFLSVSEFASSSPEAHVFWVVLQPDFLRLFSSQDLQLAPVLEIPIEQAQLLTTGEDSPSGSQSCSRPVSPSSVSEKDKDSIHCFGLSFSTKDLSKFPLKATRLKFQCLNKTDQSAWMSELCRLVKPADTSGKSSSALGSLAKLLFGPKTSKSSPGDSTREEEKKIDDGEEEAKAINEEVRKVLGCNALRRTGSVYTKHTFEEIEAEIQALGSKRRHRRRSFMYPRV